MGYALAFPKSICGGPLLPARIQSGVEHRMDVELRVEGGVVKRVDKYLM
jgi:hypothetical protein